jgi:hypothetical protein
MTESTSVLNTPVLWINYYLRTKIQELAGLEDVPFFPTGPSTIETLQKQFPEGGTMAVYDRMFRMRRGPFPHIKCEQVLYYFYASGSEPALQMIKIQEAVMRLLDRGDESAQELNSWVQGKTLDGMSCEFLFHDFKIYQLEESRDIVDFGTARTYAGNKIIIDYDYHQSTNKYERIEESPDDRPRYNKEVVIKPGILS